MSKHHFATHPFHHYHHYHRHHHRHHLHPSVHASQQKCWRRTTCSARHTIQGQFLQWCTQAINAMGTTTKILRECNMQCISCTPFVHSCSDAAHRAHHMHGRMHIKWNVYICTLHKYTLLHAMMLHTIQGTPMYMNLKHCKHLKLKNYAMNLQNCISTLPP